MEIPTPLWAPVPVLNYCLEYFSLSHVRISCDATCDYCSFFFRCAFLSKVWLHLLYSYLLDSWSEKLDPQLAFSSPGWTYLASAASSSSASFYFHSQIAQQYIYSFSDTNMCVYIFIYIYIHTHVFFFIETDPVHWMWLAWCCRANTSIIAN